MNTPEFFVTPGYGDTLRENLHYSQAVKVGNRVETSGQGGWDDEFQIPPVHARPRADLDANRCRSLGFADNARGDPRDRDYSLTPNVRITQSANTLSRALWWRLGG